MSMLVQKKFDFASTALPSDTFAVIDFNGREEISTCYEFEINLVSEKPDVDLDLVLKHPANFKIIQGDDEFVYHGIVLYIDQLHHVDGYTFYQAVLAPKQHRMNLIRHNQVFLNQTIPDILEELLKDAGLTTMDYELRIQNREKYREWEIFCQYNQTHFHSFSYWTERAGIYYFFDQGSDQEKIVIADSKVAHPEPGPGNVLEYVQPSGLNKPQDQGTIHRFTCRRQIQSQKILVRDYDYTRPSNDLSAEAEVCPDGVGQVYLYADHMHFENQEQGDRLAQIRAEELKCRKEIFSGSSDVPILQPGKIFELKNHYRDDFNQKYLTIQVSHQGDQSAFFVDGLKAVLADREIESFYHNEFKAIPADLQYRPERLTDPPTIHGTFTAVVDAAGSGQYAELDDQGRYKVILPFDMSGRKGLKASAWLRMAQPYGGSNFGMHFPLHKGAEVLLSFISGDPNRPVIIGAVPNAANPSPVTAQNATMSGIQTSGGNTIHMNDRDGEQRIIMKAGGGSATMKMGRGSPNTEFYLGSDFINHSANLTSTEITGLSKNIGALATHTTLTGSVWFQALHKAIGKIIDETPDLVEKGAMFGLQLDSETRKDDIDSSGSSDEDKSTAKDAVEARDKTVESITKMVSSVGTPIYTTIVDLAIDKFLLDWFLGIFHANDLYNQWKAGAKPKTPDQYKKCAYSIIHKDGTTLVQQKSNYSGNLTKGLLRPLGVKLEPTKGMLFSEGEGDLTLLAKEDVDIHAQKDAILTGDTTAVLKSGDSFFEVSDGKSRLVTKDYIRMMNGFTIPPMLNAPKGIEFFTGGRKNILLQTQDNGKITLQSKRMVEFKDDANHLYLDKRSLTIKRGNQKVQLTDNYIFLISGNTKITLGGDKATIALGPGLPIVKIEAGQVTINGDLKVVGNVDANDILMDI